MAFVDLLDESIQPDRIDFRNLPEIELSAELAARIETMLAQEEKYAKVASKSSIVQTKDNYVLFSNQWFILAVLCKNYALALKTYGDFFDAHIKGEHEIINSLGCRIFDNEKYVQLIPDEVDRDRMTKYILSDKNYRPGKSLLNLKKNSDAEKVNESETEEIEDERTDELETEEIVNGNVDVSKRYVIRSIKDLFCSCVLKVIPVPDSSSTYLGNIVYYLACNTELYDALEAEICEQFGRNKAMKKLPHATKECAKAIVDYIYQVDGFRRIASLFKENDVSVKIDIAKTEGLLTTNSLRYMFEKQNSVRYQKDEEGQRIRAFQDKEYELCIESGVVVCRLSGEWKEPELTETDQGNNLNALILLVNEYYGDIIEIRKILGERYLMVIKQKFIIDDVPDIFKNQYSKRFIASLLAKPFVILTGNSGTGKTRIASRLAEYLEVKDKEGNSNYLIVPVGADWTDNVKILGFYNPIANNGNGEYVRTDILKLIERANKNEGIPYFLILDEMNLSHVERYFADFLSHMEMSSSELTLDGYVGEDGTEGKLKFPQNLFVVGTVNIDETTYMFSPKVLDRANVVEFKPEKNEVLSLFDNPSSLEKVTAANDGSAEVFFKLAMSIRSGKCEVELGNARDIFAKVYEITESCGYEFAYRTVKEIRQYIAASRELLGTEEFDLMRAIDEQLLQKILPKIHGNKKEIGELLDELEKLCADNMLERSLVKIKQMKGKLAKVQYASFI